MKTYTILVTGCGGDISQSMGKILREYPLAKRVIGCDIHNDHAGHFIFHECFVIARADAPEYMDTLVDLVTKQKVDIIIPATEFELAWLVKNGQERISSCAIIRPDNFSIEIGLDKYLTAQFLEKNQLPFPKTVLPENARDISFPCIVKSRTGSGSKSLHVVKDKERLALILMLVKDAVCQEFLGTAEDEFTCGIFRSKKKEIRTIIFRRKLTGGFS